MQEIVISTVEWKTPDDLYVAFLNAAGAPSWHGHSLDALWDSITGGNVNDINPPYRIRIIGIRDTPAQCKDLLDRFIALLEEAKAMGTPVEVSLE